jgi:uncharacterized protein (DUF2461 family)
MKTYSDRNTIELISSSGKKIRVLKKAYRYMMKKMKGAELEVTDHEAIFRYPSGEMHLYDLTNQMNSWR